MRVKVHSKENGFDKLEIGKRYFVAYAGCSLSNEFTLTRKNRIEMRDMSIDPETNKVYKQASWWISRKELKKLLNMGALQYMGVFDDE